MNECMSLCISYLFVYEVFSNSDDLLAKPYFVSLGWDSFLFLKEFVWNSSFSFLGSSYISDSRCSFQLFLELLSVIGEQLFSSIERFCQPRRSISANVRPWQLGFLSLSASAKTDPLMEFLLRISAESFWKRSMIFAPTLDMFQPASTWISRYRSSFNPTYAIQKSTQRQFQLVSRRKLLYIIWIQVWRKKGKSLRPWLRVRCQIRRIDSHCL